MRNYKISLLIVGFLAVGFVFGFSKSIYANVPQTLIVINKESSIDSFFSVFMKIITNNLIVAFGISVLGFFTAGILTCVLLFYNGLILGSIINLLLKLNISVWLKFKLLIFHGSIELYSFFLFSIIGIKGYSFFYKTSSNEKNSMRILTQILFRTFSGVYRFLKLLYSRKPTSFKVLEKNIKKIIVNSKRIKV